MKARIKNTNEIIDVFCGSDGRFYTDHETVYDHNELQFDRGINPINAKELVITTEDTTPCDLWEERRYEIAKEISTSIFLYYRQKSGSLYTDKEIAQKAVEYADTLIDELKKQEQ